MAEPTSNPSSCDDQLDVFGLSHAGMVRKEKRFLLVTIDKRREQTMAQDLVDDGVLTRAAAPKTPIGRAKAIPSA